MKQKLFSMLALLLMAATGAVAQTETLLTTITATAKEQASYSTANVATVSFSYTAGGSSAYFANWGWWGYGWSATVTAAEGYTITKCIFYDNNGASATDSTDPFIVETTEEDKKPKVNGAIFGGNSSAGIKKIEVYGYVTITAKEGAVAGEYWSTYYNATQAFTADANTTIYKGTLNGTSLTLTEVTDIAAGQAVILKSTAASITLTPAASASSDFTGNDLKGGTTVASGNVAYTLSRGDGTGAVGFYKWNGTTLDGNKAHLEMPASTSRSFIDINDGTTGVIELKDGKTADGQSFDSWYSLDGRRLNGMPAQKGIYVKNGKKFIIK